MNNDHKTLSAMIDRLTDQHARYGKIDLSDVVKITDLTVNIVKSGDDEINSKVIDQIMQLQAHLISDLINVLGDHPCVSRVEECFALNFLLRAYINNPN